MNPPTDNSPSLCEEAQEKNLFDPKVKATARERKRAARYRAKHLRIGRPPRSHDEKYIEKLGTLTMHQLIRRLKQAARHASHFKHLIARADSYTAGKYRPLHDFALMCYARIQTEIEFRIKGAAS